MNMCEDCGNSVGEFAGLCKACRDAFNTNWSIVSRPLTCQAQHWDEDKGGCVECGVSAESLMVWKNGAEPEFIILCGECARMFAHTPPENEAEREILQTVRFFPATVN